MEVAQRAVIDALFLDGFGKVRNKDFANFVWAGLIENEAESALFVVLANENDRAIKKRSAQLSAVQEQLPPQRLEFLRHTAPD